MSEQMRSYGTARSIFSLIEFVGWCVVVAGIIAGFFLADSASRYVSDGEKVLLFLMGASSSIAGLFIAGAAQSWRAGVDTAELTQQMLKVARDQLEISRQGLKRQHAENPSFSSNPANAVSPQRNAGAGKHDQHRNSGYGLASADETRTLNPTADQSDSATQISDDAEKSVLGKMEKSLQDAAERKLQNLTLDPKLKR